MKKKKKREREREFTCDANGWPTQKRMRKQLIKYFDEDLDYHKFSETGDGSFPQFTWSLSPLTFLQHERLFSKQSGTAVRRTANQCAAPACRKKMYWTLLLLARDAKGSHVQTYHHLKTMNLKSLTFLICTNVGWLKDCHAINTFQRLSPVKV